MAGWASPSQDWGTIPLGQVTLQWYGLCGFRQEDFVVVLIIIKQSTQIIESHNFKSMSPYELELMIEDLENVLTISRYEVRQSTPLFKSDVSQDFVLYVHLRLVE